MTAAVFLDRDNTIIHNDGDLGDPDRVELIQGAASAISSLCGLGYCIVVVSNQGGVARGAITEDQVQAVNERIRALMREATTGGRIDAFYYCPYHPEGPVEAYAREHPSRKPQPGMLIEAARAMRLDLSQSWMVGDQMRDVEAGVAAGTRTMLLCDPAGGPLPDDQTEAEKSGEGGGSGGAGKPAVRPNYVVQSLVEAVRIIAQQPKPDIGYEAHRYRSNASQRWSPGAVAQVQRAPRPGKAQPPNAQPRADETAAPAEDRAAEDRSPAGRSANPAASPAPTEGPSDPKRATDQVAASSPHADSVEDTGSEPVSVDAATPNREADRAEPGPPTAKAGATNPHGMAGSAPASSSGSPSLGDPAPTDKRQAVSATHEAHPEANAASQRLLTSILQELRNQRGGESGFSYLTVVAIVLQMIAALCLVGGLWMTGDDVLLFFKWIGAALMMQLATIAMLLFARAG